MYVHTITTMGYSEHVNINNHNGYLAMYIAIVTLNEFLS